MTLDLSQREQIYAEYYEKVSRYVYGRINIKSDAEDLVSDVFFKIYTKFDTYNAEKSSLSTWIYRITQNTVTDYYRNNRNFSEIPDNISNCESVEDGLINDEMLKKLAEGLEKLEKRQKNIIILHYYSGMKLKDIAEKIGISYVYAKVLHKKALEHLKDFLN